ncbi:uncharacterized protein LOC110106341 isoform X2 [Dendrobium catenatum]|uniref:uncharacterized protein LOC110106341 isoform X2 n=1 Tax=Dendrobium catenatum TaxID=906689 RepID=UPI0009F4F387|nr:uncharacterized protein LOC110106341 isoform X2 [Dendrobium catenatum]
MIMYDQDPDVLRWGLHLLQGDLSNTAYSEATIQSDANIYQAEYSRENSVAIDCTIVENDEIIAHALQEELSQVALAEARGTSPAGEEHMQASVLAQDWLGPAVRNSNSENEGTAEAVNAVELSTFSSSQLENISEGQSWSLELTDDFSSLDGEVGKRLDKMVPVPHVPRINGEIPSLDEATSDHERLLERLKLYELVELKVQGDGNCQFRSLSDQFYRSTEHHNFVRQQVVDQLKSHPDIYEGYVPMAYEEYLRKMSKSGEWGDHVTLQAAADSYGVKIFVLTSFKDTCYIEIMPIDQKSKRVIFLSFWAEVHYNSIYPEGELPAPETKRKKGWWHFGHKH